MWRECGEDETISGLKIHKEEFSAAELFLECLSYARIRQAENHQHCSGIFLEPTVAFTDRQADAVLAGDPQS
jgi:hypothetical protein